MKEKKHTIFRYLKPYTFIITVVVIFVAIQAVADLYLPNLMSDIINNGVAKVEYSVNEEKLMESIQKGELPEFTRIYAGKQYNTANVGK